MREAGRGPTLATVLAMPRDAEFMHALADLVFAAPGRGNTDISASPEVVRMILVLRALWLNVSTDGMWKYLEETGAGEDFDEAIAWCRLIGAQRAAEYLTAVAAVFPNRRVPDDDEARRDYIDALSERAPDPLALVDGEYSGAVDELPARLRAHVESRAAELREWIERGAPR